MEINLNAGHTLPDELKHCSAALALGLVHAELLAAALGLGIKSLHARLARDPNSLPVVTRIKGNRRIFFKYSDVQNWIAGVPVVNQEINDEVTVEAPRRARGRPRKIGGTAK